MLSRDKSENIFIKACESEIKVDDNTNKNMLDEYYMEIAINLAKNGIGKVNPNPLVGAVIVRDDEIISSAYHDFYGDLHAERKAILNCKKNLIGATLYVNLEPCCHYGKTPPCTEIIIESGIKKVVVSCLDPNPLVSGKGVEILRDNGIEVEVGVLEEKGKRLNEVFFNYIKYNRPYVVMKYAMSIDGKICTYSGESKWISCDESRRKVHRDRNTYMAIMVGIGTILKDNPMLTSRMDLAENKKIRNPIRIICDTNLRTPIDSNIVSSAKEIKTIIAVGKNIDEKKKKEYENQGVEILVVDEYMNLNKLQKNRIYSKLNSLVENIGFNKDSLKEIKTDDEIMEGNNFNRYEVGEGINLNLLMDILGERGIDSVLLEGGGKLNFSALESNIVDKVEAYISPQIIGGKESKTPVEGIGFPNLEKSKKITNYTFKNIGKDIYIEGYIGR